MVVIAKYFRVVHFQGSGLGSSRAGHRAETSNNNLNAFRTANLRQLGGSGGGTRQRERPWVDQKHPV